MENKPIWTRIDLASVPSTNDYLKALARQGAPHGTVVTAQRQTRGRGRLGRSFVSPEGGLYLSVLLRPEGGAERLPTLTPCAALAVCAAVERTCGFAPEIKWPNDLLVGGKKLCGILTEGVADAGGRLAAVVGIGINANTRPADLPPELGDTACSLMELTGRVLDINALTDALLEALGAVYGRWLGDDKALAAEYRALCSSVGREASVQWGGERKRVFVLAVNDDFTLTVRAEDGVSTLGWGELNYT